MTSGGISEGKETLRIEQHGGRNRGWGKRGMGHGKKNPKRRIQGDKKESRVEEWNPQ
jgi:hypothetical protein